MSAPFKKLNPKIYGKTGGVITPDTEYWKKLSVPVLIKEFGPIDYIDFSPIEPYHFAVTCSARIQIYNPITKLVTKNLSRFRENAYGASFRSDGRLLCVGGEESVVKLFDVNTKSLLRLFKGHTAAVHRTFFTPDKTHIVSYSDDKSVTIWDIPTEKSVNTYTDHVDYIRAGAVNPVVPQIVLSGSYDKFVKMYDNRTNSCVLSVEHGCPVESVLFLPSGGVFLSAGGTNIKVWDAFAGGKLLTTFSSHHKTITCLHLASNNNRLLSGSLDRHVKIYDISTFKVVHTLDYPNAVLSLGTSKNDDSIAVGMVDGCVSVQRREEEIKLTKTNSKMASYKYISYKRPGKVDEVVNETVKEGQSKHDNYLRKFEFSKALDCVLAPYFVNKSPAVTVSVISELLKRKVLFNAFTNQKPKVIAEFLRLLIKYLSDYRFTKILIEATNVFLDVYETTPQMQTVETGKLLLTITRRVKEEEELMEQLTQLQGSLELLLSGAIANEQIVAQNASVVHNLLPSENAQKTLIVNIV